MRTLLIVKPGWAERPGLLFRIGSMMHKYGLGVSLHHTSKPSREFWEKFYSSHVQKSYFENMIEHLMYSSCIFIIFEGEDAVKRVRDWVVKIRSHYNKSSKDTDNVMHASDMEESAKKEIEFVIEFITKSRL